MSSISIYLLSIVGMVVILLIIDLILPSGQTSKYIKSISAIFLVLVICTPIVKILQGNIDFSSIFSSVSYELDENYLYNVQLKEAETLQENTEKMLDEAGYNNVEVVVNILTNQLTMKISSIFADLSKTVLTNNSTHINNYTAVQVLIANYCGVEEDKIIVDG